MALDELKAMKQKPGEGVRAFADRFTQCTFGTNLSASAIMHQFKAALYHPKIREHLCMGQFKHLQEVVETVQRLERIMGSSRDIQRQAGTAPPKPCYNCGNTGHLQANCPHPKKTRAPKAKVQELELEEEGADVEEVE